MAAVVPIKLSVEGAEQVKSSLMNVGKMLGAAFAADKIKDFVSLGLKEWSQMQGAVGGLTAALGKQSKALLDLSEATARNSTFQQDEIVNGYKRLAMYGLTEEQIAKLSPVMQDLAATTGSQEDAAKMLGQAIQTGGGKLATFGVQVDKNASAQDRYNDLINGGASAIEGQAKAAFDSMNPMDKMNKLWADAAEAVGTALVPTLNELYEMMPDITDVLSNVTKGLVSTFKFAQLGVQGIVLGVTKALGWLAGAVSHIPGLEKWGKNTEEAMARMAKVTDQEIMKTVQSIDKLWQAAETPKDLGKGKGKKGKGLSTESKEEQDEAKKAAEKAAEEAKELAKDRADAIILINREARDMALSEYDIEINALRDKMEEEKKLFEKKEGDTTEIINENEKHKDNIRKNFDANVAKIRKKEEKDRDKIQKDLEKDAADKKQLDEREIDRKKKEADDAVKIEQDKQQLSRDTVSKATGDLANLFEGQAKFIALYKTLAIAQATMDTWSSATSAYRSALSIGGPLGMALAPIAAGVAVATGLANVQKIATTKFAYGGVAIGGVPGVDSVPAMLMPGEIVYNPNNPDPRLLADINSSNGGSNIQIGGTSIVVQGNVSKGTVAEIGKVTEKALITAMRKAQSMGKITAKGMKIRN